MKVETVTTEVPVDKLVQVEKEVLVDKIIQVEKEVPVDKLVQVEIQVPIDRIVQVEKEIPVSKITEVIREIAVDKVQTVTTEVPVDKVSVVTNEIPITKVEVHTTEIPVTTVVQVEKQVPVDKIQIVEVEKPIFHQKSVNKLNEISNQIEHVMGLKDLLKSRSNELGEQYEVLVKSIEQLDSSVQQLTNVEFNNKVEVLNRKLDSVNEFLGKVKFRNNLEVSNDALIREVNAQNDKIHLLELEVERMTSLVNKTIQEKMELEERYKNVKNLEDVEKLRFYYNELLTFTFKNLGPTPFDPQEARHHWENIIK